MMLTAWFLFSLVDSSVKWLLLAGLTAGPLSFVRYSVAFVLSLGLAFGQRAALDRPTSGQALLLLARGGLLVSATVFNFIALNHLPLTVTAAIMFSAPIIVSALSGPLLGERVGRWRWFAVFLGFAGVLIVIRPWSEAFHWASLLVVYNAFALAFFSIITRKLADSVSAQTMQVYMGALGTVALLPLAILDWQNPGTLRDWMILAGVGFWAWAGHEIFARAHRLADASVLMPFAYSFILYMAALGYLIFADVPDRMTILGASVIVVSGLIVWWRETGARNAEETA
ncbi:MAG: DMT family transporter [Pseudomonadota bacterium]